MATTQLSPQGVPGRPYSFTPKSTGAHTGLFTALSVMGTPGGRRSFTAKAPAVVPHTGLFTALSVMGVPGRGYVITAKTPAPVTPVTPETPPAATVTHLGGGQYWYEPPKKKDPWAQAKREDEELLQFLAAIAPMLN